MQIQLEQLQTLVLKASTTIDTETINKTKKEIIDSLKSKVEIKGFRKGKIPDGMIYKRYQKSILEEVNQKYHQEFVTEIQKKNERVYRIKPIEKEITSFEEAVQLETEVELFAQYDLPQMTALPLSKLDKNIDKGEFDEKLYDILVDIREWTSVEEPAQENDRVHCSIEFFENDTIITDTEVKESYLYLKKSKLEKDLEKHFIGVKKDDDTSFPFTAPDNYLASLASKELVVKAKILLVERPTELKVDKTLFDMLNSSFQLEEGNAIHSEQDLNSKVEEIILEEREQRLLSENKQVIIEQLQEKLDFELPPSIEEEIKSSYESDTQRADSDEKKEQVISMDDRKKSYYIGFFLQDYMKEHKLDIDRDKFHQRLDYHMMAGRLDKDFYNTPQGESIMQRYHHMMIEDCVIKDIIAKN